MSWFPSPPPPAVREPEPPEIAAEDPGIVALYSDAKRMYREGRYPEAFGLYRRLVDLVPSDARLACWMGLLHLWGAGPPEDSVEAERWLGRAARMGDSYANLTVAKVCRDTGRLEVARQWLEEAAARGYPPAIFSIGHGWEFGYWGAVNVPRALEYYARAAAKGYARAEQRGGAILLRGRASIWRAPLGLFRYLTGTVKLVGLLWRDPYDERVVW